MFNLSKSSNVGEGYFLNEWIGIKFDLSAVKSFLIGTFLTMILFIGPIVQDLVNIYLDYRYINDQSFNLKPQNEIK